MRIKPLRQRICENHGRWRRTYVGGDSVLWKRDFPRKIGENCKLQLSTENNAEMQGQRRRRKGAMRITASSSDLIIKQQASRQQWKRKTPTTATTTPSASKIFLEMMKNQIRIRIEMSFRRSRDLWHFPFIWWKRPDFLFKMQKLRRCKLIWMPEVITSENRS